MARERPLCGSPGGYKAHWRRNEEIDEACRIAMNDAVNRGRRSKALFRQAETRAKGLAMDALILRHKEEYKALYTAAYKEEFNDLFDEIMVDGVLESSHA